MWWTAVSYTHLDVYKRQSLHDPIMPLNCEAEKEGQVDVILNRIRPFLAKYTELSTL